MLTCPTPGTTPSLNIGKHKIVNPENEMFGLVCQVPAGWVGEVNYHYWFPAGVKPTKNPEIAVNAILIVPGSSEVVQVRQTYTGACWQVGFWAHRRCCDWESQNNCEIVMARVVVVGQEDSAQITVGVAVEIE